MADITVPTSIKNDASVNVAPALQAWILANGNGNTIHFPAGSKYLIAGNRDSGPGGTDTYLVTPNVLNSNGQPCPVDIWGPAGTNGYACPQPAFSDIPGLNMKFLHGFLHGIELSGLHDCIIDGTGAVFLLPDTPDERNAPSSQTGWDILGQSAGHLTVAQIIGSGVGTPAQVYGSLEGVFNNRYAFGINSNCQNVTFQNVYVRGGRRNHGTMDPAYTEHQHAFSIIGTNVRNIEIKNCLIQQVWSDALFYAVSDLNNGTIAVDFHDNVITGVGRQGVTPKSGGVAVRNNTWNDLSRWCIDCDIGSGIAAKNIHFDNNTWLQGDQASWRLDLNAWPMALGQTMGYLNHEKGISTVSDMQVTNEKVYRNFLIKWFYRPIDCTDTAAIPPNAPAQINDSWLIANNTTPISLATLQTWQSNPGNQMYLPAAQHCQVYSNTIQCWGGPALEIAGSGEVHDNTFLDATSALQWDNTGVNCMPAVAGARCDNNNKYGSGGGQTQGTTTKVCSLVPPAKPVINQPANNTQVAVGTDVQLSAAADAGTTAGAFLIASGYLGTIDCRQGYGFWLGTVHAGGAGTAPITFVAKNGQGSATSDPINLIIGNAPPPPTDTTAPVGDNTHTQPYITVPATGDNVGPGSPTTDGTNNVNMGGIASDAESGISTTVFVINGPNGFSTTVPGIPFGNSGYVANWDVTGRTTGTYTIQFRATNGAGLTATGPANTFTVTMSAAVARTGEAWNKIWI